MPRKACCCGGGNYVAIACRSWGGFVFSGYHGLTALNNTQGLPGYSQYFGANGLFKNKNSPLGPSGPWGGMNPFYKFYKNTFIIGGLGAAWPAAPTKVVGFTGCVSGPLGGNAFGGYNGTTCTQAILETDNSRPIYIKLWGAGGGAASPSLFGGNGAYTQVSDTYNENYIACVGMGGLVSGETTGSGFTNWNGVLATYDGGGGQGYDAWGGGAAFVSTSFLPQSHVAIVGGGGGAGSLIQGPGHGGATFGRDGAGSNAGRGANQSNPGTGGSGGQSGVLYTGGRGSSAGGGGGGGGLGGGGGGGFTGYPGGGGSSTVTEWSRSGDDGGPPNICDPFYWMGSYEEIPESGNKIWAGLGGEIVPPNSIATGRPYNNSEYGMSGKVGIVYSSLRCLCDESLNEIPEQTYICLNQNQYDYIINQAQGASSCYGYTGPVFGGATGLSAYGGITYGFLEWTFGEGYDVPKSPSFYYEGELYYLIGQCPVLCDPAYQIPEDAALTDISCREFGKCCEMFFAYPYCKVPNSGTNNCFAPELLCPEECVNTVAEPFYACIEEGVDYPEGVFWTKKNDYFYQVTKISGWIPYGENLYKLGQLGPIIEQAPCCEEDQTDCYREPQPDVGNGNCCRILEKPFTKPHPGKARIQALINFEGSPLGSGYPNPAPPCSVYPGCLCPAPARYNDTLQTTDLRVTQIKYFDALPSYGIDPTCSSSASCNDTAQRALLYSFTTPNPWDEIWEQNPYVPVFRIESYCSCAGVCPHPEIFIDEYTDCESFNNYGKPVLIVRSASVSDIVNELNSMSDGHYTVTNLSSEDFWFGYRYKDPLNSSTVPGDDYFYDDVGSGYDDEGGYRCVRTYYARSPYYGVVVGTFGSLIDNCECYYRPCPLFLQSNGTPSQSGNPGCAVEGTYKTLVEWQNNPSTNPVISFGSFFGGGSDPSILHLCSGFYDPCIVDYWNGSACSFTALTE